MIENSLNRFELERKHNVRTFEIWMTPDGNTRGYEKFDKGFPKSCEGYDISHNCFGQTACICIVSNDKRIERAHAVHFATCVVLNKMKAFSISTEGL
jgi:hypothetical protein